MSKEGDRQSVFRTTKVRTALKGDSSWIQRSKGEPEEDEKPWVAEVRAGRLNGAGGDAESDATSKEQEARPPPSTDNSKTPSSGYLIRGVFTKTDTKLAQPSSANGHIGTSGFVKKASDGYKKIAPHTVRPNTETTEQSEPSLSTEEQDKRTEAASSVLKNSGSRQRSYVLSAAKKYESSEKPESSAPPITSFVAKRVVISEDEDSDPVEPKAEIPATPSSSSLVAQQSYGVEMSVDDPVPPVKKNVPSAPEPKPMDKPETTPTKSVTEPITTITTTAPVAEKDTFKTPEPKPQSSPKTSVTDQVPPVAQKDTSNTPDPKPQPTPKPSVTEPITTITTTAPVAEKDTFKTPEPKPQSTPKTSVTGPITTTAPVAQKDTFKTPEPKPQSTPKTSVIETITPTPVAKKDTFKTPEPKPQSTPKISVTEPITTITTTAPVAEKDTFKTPEPKPQSTPKTSVPDPVLPASIAVQKTPQSKPRTEPPPPISVQKVEKTSNLNDVDLMDLTQSDPQKQVNPVPTTTDLLTGLGSSLPQSEKTRGSLDLLALDVIPIDTNSEKLSTDKSNAKVETTQMVVRSKDSKSSTETVTITTTKTEIIKGNDLHHEYSSLPQSQKTLKSLDLLAEDVIPIDTRISINKPQSKVDTSQTVMYTRDSKSSLPQSERTKESLDLLGFDFMPSKENTDKYSSNKTQTIVETSQTVLLPKKDFTRTIERFDPIMSYRENMAGDVTSRLYDDFPSDIDITRSSDSVSPRNEWTPSTLLTTIKKRETKADPPPMADYTYSRVQDSHAQDTKLLDTDTKRSFVYVKEYVNLSELSTQNDVRDGDYLTSTTSTYAYSSPSSDGDYLTSTTSKYAYSSPSSANSSACTYCGRLVGNDAKITIEHLNISCHPECFKCGICSKPMGDFLDNMFLHRGTVHCENCYANVI